MFGYEREKVAGGMRRLHNEELQIKEDKLGGECGIHRGDEKCT
jgi:hypothetical protein